MTLEQLQQYQDRASRYLEEMADELQMLYGYESFNLHVCGPLTDLIVAHYIELDAVQRLGGLQAITYLHGESDVALMKKIGRLLLSDSQEIAEAAQAGLMRAKDADASRIQDAYRAAAREPSRENKIRLSNATEHLADGSRHWTEAAVNGFVKKGTVAWRD